MRALRTAGALLGLLASGLVATGLAGCESANRGGSGQELRGQYTEGFFSGGRREAAPAPAPAAAQRPAPAAEVRPAAAPAPAPAPAPVGSNVATLFKPTGERATSAIMLEEILPAQVRRNAEFNSVIRVTNLTNGPLQNVVVTKENFQNYQLRSAAPSATASDNTRSMWSLGTLGPREVREIRLTGIAPNTGTSGNCLDVTYNNTVCAQTQVVEPALAINKTITPEVVQCDPITVTITVRNTGTGVAENVVVRDNLPAGVTTADNKQTWEQNIGNLAAGEQKTVSFQARAARTGRFENFATAAGNGITAIESNRVATVVRKPKLELACQAPATVILGRNATFRISVSNTGDAACNTVVSVPLPAGVTFVSSSTGGTLQGNAVTFNVGSLPAGQKRDLELVVRPAAAGNVPLTATANCPCADPVTTNCATTVRGVPAILVECVDNPDPITVNETTTYTITVTNQGFAPDSNVRVVARLPEGLTFVSAGGATAGTANGQTITFAPVATLAPRQSVTFTVVARAARAAGDVRFNIDVTSDNFKNPISEIESTNLYE